MITCTLEKACVLTCIFFILFLFVEFIAAITSSHLLGIFLIIFSFYMLLKYVGMFALYPGSFAYIQSDIEMRGSQRLAQNIVESFKDFFRFIEACNTNRNQFLYRVFIVKHIEDVIKLLKKFEGNLSSEKRRLLRVYEAMDEYLNGYEKIRKNDGSEIEVRLRQFLWEPQKVKFSLGEENNHFIKTIASKMKQKIEVHFIQIRNILINFKAPQEAGPFKSTLYKLYSEKLFQIRFAYMSWQGKYEYFINIIDTECKKQKIEVAVITRSIHHSQKTLHKNSNKAMMFCLPNGAYLQYFVLESQYIQMYLDLGYKIVLWNYRGYAQSTGEPALHRSIIDVSTVFQYCKNQLSLDIEVVHGYSIGGPPSVSLAMKYPNDIKVLVTDRTFFNILKIAQEFSPILQKLCKFILARDSKINCAQMFARAKNACKIIIWADNDEIIPQSSSLKIGVINNMIDYIIGRGAIKSGQQNQMTEGLIKEQEEYNMDTQNFESYRSKSYFQNEDDAQNKDNMQILKESIQDFTHALISLKKQTQQLKSGKPTKREKDMYSSMQEGIIFQNSQDNEDSGEEKKVILSILDQFWQTFNAIDGGGLKGSDLSTYIEKCLQKVVRSFNRPNRQNTNLQEEENVDEGDLEEIKDSNDEEKASLKILNKVESFVLGLISYGCCFRGEKQASFQKYSQYLKEHEKGEMMFGNNLKYTLEKVNKILQDYSEPINEQKHLHISLQRIREILDIMELYKDIIKSNSMKKGWKGCGYVIPTKSGHNGDLENSQLEYLKELVHAYGSFRSQSMEISDENKKQQMKEQQLEQEQREEVIEETLTDIQNQPESNYL